ncbi:T9SS type A sorting domain-containing protein [Aureivirga sp. CE67]|uniref:T9SS type A sorting domain-containing protein n=1 Tax=Aureivirga sp. CE67 TaxID=1788983 RepID=UPI0018CB853D|nr:T9SS type A sorting domain-containing protein [Aureivirga sp. CE67]
MKKLVLFISIFMLSYFSYGQYKPLLEEDKVWVYCEERLDVYYSGEGTEPHKSFYGKCFKIYLDGKVELDGNEYYQVFMQVFYEEGVYIDYNLSEEEIAAGLAQLPVTYEDLESSEILEIMENAEEPIHIGLIREDVEDKRVFSRVYTKDENQDTFLTSELLIYNFNLNELEVFENNFYCQNGELSVDMSFLVGMEYDENLRAVNKETITINGEELIHFEKFETVDGVELLNSKGENISFIEGFGSDNNLLHPFSYEFFYLSKDTENESRRNESERCNFGKLMFVSESGEVVYNPSEFAHNNYILNIENQEVFLKNIEIYPIPTSDYLRIKAVQQNLSFELFDTNGRKLKLFSEKSNSDYSLNISHLEKGVYFLKITNENNISITKKVMKQ